MERRKVLHAAAGLVTGVFTYFGLRSWVIPDPRVVEFSAERTDPERVVVDVTLVNDGGSGGVAVSIETVQDGRTVERFTRYLQIGSGDRVERQFVLSPPNQDLSIGVSASQAEVPLL